MMSFAVNGWISVCQQKVGNEFLVLVYLYTQPFLHLLSYFYLNQLVLLLLPFWYSSPSPEDIRLEQSGIGFHLQKQDQKKNIYCIPASSSLCCILYFINSGHHTQIIRALYIIFVSFLFFTNSKRNDIKQ